MSKILYIHIGAPKCGSTYIQELIKKNADLLNNNGYLTEPWLNYDNHWGLAAYCCSPKDRQYFIKTLNAFSEETFTKFQNDIHEKINNFEDSLKRYDRALVSSEAYFSYSSTKESLYNLNRIFLKNFDEIRLILFYRQPEEYLSSIYCQLVKGPQMYTAPPNRAMITERGQHLFGFKEKIENWRNLGIRVKVSAVEVGKQGVKGQDLGVEFFKIVNLKDNTQLNLETTDDNKSPTAFQLSLLRSRNKLMRSILFPGKNEIYNTLFRRLTSALIMSIPSKKKFRFHIEKKELDSLNTDYFYIKKLKYERII